MYKAAEKKVRTGEDQYLVDFFIGLQVHCGAITALNGDLQVGLAEIFLYKPALSECVASPERPLPQPLHIGGQPYLEDVTPASDFIGQIEESDETNNVGSVLLFVKASDTTEWEAAKILFNFIFLSFGSTANVTLQGLVDFLGSCITGSITVTTLAIGSVGAILLLVLTAEPVGEEWPTSIKDPTGTFDEIIVDQATIAHIQDGAQREEKCERWSHQAILDDPWRIRFAIEHVNLLFKSPMGQYFYYAADGKDEWVVMVKAMEKRKGRVGTAYRVDCAPPYLCRRDNKYYWTILEKWLICEKFILIWP